MAAVTKPFPLISKADASYVFWPETEYRCSDECINLKSVTECAVLGSLVQIDAPAGSCDYYIHGGLTDWKMPVTGCITKESAGYAENPSKQGFGCKRCRFFDADSLDCYRGVDKNSPGPAPGIIHPNGCCNLNEPDAKRGKMTRRELTTLFDGRGFSEAARLLNDMATSLNPGLQVVAFKLQEAMMHGDVRSRLQDAINDMHRGSGTYGYYIDHDGDGETGDVIYSSNGDVRKASYEVTTQGGKAVTHIDDENSTNVVPVTSYQEEADEDDHYASMQEAFKAGNIYTDLPVYERFISKGERDQADEGDFAGKGKSFPILKPGDVSAAVHAMGRAGSGNYGMAQLKANIIRIAKKKGWTKQLPKSWRGEESGAGAQPLATGSATVLGVEALRKLFGTGDIGSICEALKSNTQEAARAIATALNASVSGETLHNPTKLALCESASTLEQIVLKEARADYEIKLIAPGKGSSAFYPAEVLKRDGPSVFKAGTHVYLNHPTAAEEAARPEGDVNNLAGVLATNAVYHESHAKGPGLYARMKVFQDHAQAVEEKAAHVGMSIRASGVAESGKKQDGLPILKELTSAESVDVVTHAGAGGMILTEAARPNSQEGEMTLQEAQKLIDEGIAKATAPLIERGLKMDAREECARILETSKLPQVAKTRITEAAVSKMPVKDGVLNVEEFRKVVVAEAQAEGQYLASITGAGRVVGMGESFGPTVVVDEEKARKEAKRVRKEAERLRESENEVFAEITGLPIRKVEAA